jgi:hypothetical protein
MKDKWTEMEQWWKAKLNKKAICRLIKKRTMAADMRLAKKTIALRYLQLT